MFGLDDAIANLSDGASLALVVVAASLLGLRHATDPDHLVAVTTLVAAGRERTARLAARLGLAWSLGHATTLLAFGLPAILYERYLPERVQQAAETAIGATIVLLAVWLLARWRRGRLHVHVHEHGGVRHAHLHSHARDEGHQHRHTIRARSPWQAYAIGLVHGMGGSAGVGILLVATVDGRVEAVAALVVLALFTGVSMTLLTTGLGLTVSRPSVRRSFHRVAPVMGIAALLFGVWYSLGALELAP